VKRGRSQLAPASFFLSPRRPAQASRPVTTLPATSVRRKSRPW
jgi:hypothetical protein